MHPLSSYSIPFSGLRQGVHKFNFLVEHNFFEAFEYSPVKDGRVWVNVTLEKHDTMMVLEFLIKGTLNVTCDRCLEPFELPIEGLQKLIVKFGEKTYEETDEILVLSRGEHTLELAQYIYEFITLLLPFKVVHPDDEAGNSTCDPVAIQQLREKLDNQGSQDTDPRWEALKKLR